MASSTGLRSEEEEARLRPGSPRPWGPRERDLLVDGISIRAVQPDTAFFITSCAIVRTCGGFVAYPQNALGAS